MPIATPDVKKKIGADKNFSRSRIFPQARPPEFHQGFTRNQADCGRKTE
jgi:hypothetical protein